MDADDPWFQLFNEIGILAQLSRALFDARLPEGLITPHFAVLNHLIRVADGRTPLDLARAFQVPKTSMTHTLAGLEARALVAMRANPQDGRSKRVWVTPEGRALRDGAIAAATPNLARIAAGWDGDAAGLLARLTSLREVMDAARAST